MDLHSKDFFFSALSIFWCFSTCPPYLSVSTLKYEIWIHLSTYLRQIERRLILQTMSWLYSLSWTLSNFPHAPSTLPTYFSLLFVHSRYIFHSFSVKHILVSTFMDLFCLYLHSTLHITLFSFFVTTAAQHFFFRTWLVFYSVVTWNQTSISEKHQTGLSSYRSCWLDADRIDKGLWTPELNDQMKRQQRWTDLFVPCS